MKYSSRIMSLSSSWPSLLSLFFVAVCAVLCGCSSDERTLQEWARTGQIDRLSRVLDSANREKRLQAVRCLGSTAQAAAIFPLMRCLLGDDPGLAAAAALALGELAQSDVLSDAEISELIRLLQDENCKVRPAIADALGMSRRRAPLEALLIATETDEADLQRCAAIAIGELIRSEIELTSDDLLSARSKFEALERGGLEPYTREYANHIHRVILRRLSLVGSDNSSEPEVGE